MKNQKVEYISQLETVEITKRSTRTIAALFAKLNSSNNFLYTETARYEIDAPIFNKIYNPETKREITVILKEYILKKYKPIYKTVFNKIQVVESIKILQEENIELLKRVEALERRND